MTGAEKARSDSNREVSKVPEVSDEEHAEEITGLVEDESSLSEAVPGLPGVSFEFAVVAVLTSDERGLSGAVITVRAEIKSVSPYAETTEPPVRSRAQEVEKEVAQDEDVKKVEVDGSNEEVEPDGEAEKSAGSEVLTGAERT